MSVSNELQFPVSEDNFEAMCLVLYSLAWRTNDLMRVGRSGQAQFGVDIIGHDGKRNVGIQCKHYVKKKFTIATVTDDIAAADMANLDIDHLLFATTSPAKAELVKTVHDLSNRRRASGKFTVSVDFWNGISDRIKVYPEVGRAFIPGFPGSTLLVIEELTTQRLNVVQQSAARQEVISQQVIDAMSNVSTGRPALTPDARGDEADPGVVASLNHVRDRIRAGATSDAKQLLTSLGDPVAFRDEFSKFRWHTNAAAIAMLEGDQASAARGFIDAFSFAPNDEKAHVNRAHAYFIRKQFEAADIACDEALTRFPDSAPLWGMSLHMRIANSRPAPAVPAHVLDKPDFLFSKASLLVKEGDHRGAIKMLQRCIELDGGSLDARRSLLAEALGWTAVDSVASLMGQLPQEQRLALTDALERFEPLETVIPAQQSGIISQELATNAVSALVVLGQMPRARRLAQQLLSQHPQLEQLLRVHVVDLANREDIRGVHAFTDHRLEELPPSVLALLAEISAHRGDVEWTGRIFAVAKGRFAEDEKLQRILPLEYLAMWRHGDREQALSGIREFVALHPDYILAAVIEGRFLQHLGKRSEAIAIARASLSKLPTVENYIDLSYVYVADLFLDLKLYEDAARLYEQLVRTPGADELTEKLLVCLVQTDQRSKAKRVLEALSADVRGLSRFKRIEINLAASMGNWTHMRALLEQELAEDPDNTDYVLAYADVLFRLGDRVALQAFAARDPALKDAKPKHELAFAKYQMTIGLADFAVRRLYRLFRAHPSNAELAGHFLAQLLLGEKVTALIAPLRIGPGSAVQLKHDAELFTVAIDYLDASSAGSWPELVPASSDAANRLEGLQVHDQLTLRRGIFEQEVEVVGIDTLIAFAVGKAHELIAAQASSNGPLWSFRVIKDDGQVDIDLLQRSARERRLKMEKNFRLYSQHRLPTCVLAKLAGTDPVTLQLEWPSKLAPLYVGVGSVDERNAALSQISDTNQPFVVDLLTIAELVRLNVANAITALPRRPLVAQTQRERLLVILGAMGEPRATANMSEQDGRLRMVDIPQWYFMRRKRLLQAILAFMDTSCDVVPVTGPEILTDVHRSMTHILDRDALDTLYLCLERSAVLLSEDGGLRGFATGAGVASTMSIQPLLMRAVERGILSRKIYVSALEVKLLANHDFVSVAAEDLLLMALNTPQRIAPAVRSALQTFRRPSLDLASGLRVCIEFIDIASRQMDPVMLGCYCNLILEVLKDGRPQIGQSLVRLLSKQLRALFGRNGRRIPSNARRAFGKSLLKRR